MINYKKIFLLLFCLLSFSARAQFTDYLAPDITASRFLIAEQTKRAGEQEKLVLSKNKVKKILVLESLGGTLKKLLFDINGRCTDIVYYNNAEDANKHFTYDERGNVIKIITEAPGFKKTENIEYEGTKPIGYQIYVDPYTPQLHTEAEYEGDKIIRIATKNKNNETVLPTIIHYGEDTVSERIEVPNKEEIKREMKEQKKRNERVTSKYESSVETDTVSISPETYEEPEPDIEEDINKRLTIYEVVSKKDTVAVRFGLINAKLKWIFKDDRLIKIETEKSSEKITVAYFYKENGLIDYTETDKGGSKVKAKYEYSYYD